jgi:hypothetical protein
LTAVATDTAGNASPASVAVGITVDLSVPAAPVITSPTEGAIDLLPPVTIVGTAEENTTVTVVIDGGIAGTTASDGGGAWSFQVLVLAPGGHTVTARATDDAGNTGADATVVNFTTVT